MSTTIDPRLHPIVAVQPYPLVFATVSGAHLYGFPSPDSDYDLRGVHVLPLRAVLGLEEREETIEVSEARDGLEPDSYMKPEAHRRLSSSCDRRPP